MRSAEKTSSTVAAAQQNTFNYVFRVHNYDNSPAPQQVLRPVDWRLSSDYGYADQERKPIRTQNASTSAQSLPRTLLPWRLAANYFKQGLKAKNYL